MVPIRLKTDIRIERVFEADDYIGETPVWSSAEQALYWINCEKSATMHRWCPADGVHQTWPMPKRIGGLVLKSEGGLLVVLSDGLYDFDPSNGELTLRVASPLPSHVMLHECICDRQGRLWVGAYDHEWSPTNRTSQNAAYFRLDNDELVPVITRISVANGLAVSPDGRTLYAADSPLRRVDAFDLDPQVGATSNRRLFIQLEEGEGFVDGATVDVDGGYWLAVVGFGQLRRYAPDGSLDRTIQLPFSNPTKPAFGGPNLDILYLTTTRLPITLPGVAGAELNGALYSVEAGVKGIDDARLAG